MFGTINQKINTSICLLGTPHETKG